MMTNCWSFGIFFILFLGSFCIWNCLHREKAKKIADWYGCIDQQGKPTDFSILYKLPSNHKSPQANIREGSAYIYLTPDSSSRLQSGGVSSVLSYSDSASEWIFSNYSIKEKLSVPAQTLNTLYNDHSFKNVAAIFMYNDEFPNGSTSFTHGHSKGVVVFSEYGGYWIIHSAPKFPPAMSDGYSYPSTALRYGQTMLCISLPPISKEIVENIAWQLIQNDINIYSSNLPDAVSSKYPILREVLVGNKSKQPPFHRVAEIPTYYGKSFTSFAKNKYFDKDLYSMLVAPTLKTNLFVETWRNGPGPLPSSCNSTFHVENIESIFSKSASMEFTTHKDHSKWAVAQASDQPYICIGDINRMKSQFERGGGTVCLWSLSIWYRFSSLIQHLEGCPKMEFDV